MKINFHGLLIDRSQIPSCVKWLAQDEDGAVFGYTEKPIIYRNVWRCSIGFKFICYFLGEVNWKDTLMNIEKEEMKSANDNVNHPEHYEKHPSGVECIEIVRHMNFNLGNAIKYLWRAGKKDPTKTIEDLSKAIWYIQDEIKRLEKENDNSDI